MTRSPARRRYRPENTGSLPAAHFIAWNYQPNTFATRYLKNNPGDLRGLASILGHRSLNTVMIYTQPTLADLAGRMENI